MHSHHHTPCRRTDAGGSTRPTARRLVALLCAAVLPCMAGPAVAELHGLVNLSPSCGGAQEEGRGCRAPYGGAALELLGLDGQRVASAQAGPDGRYRIAAPAGRYRLRVVAPTRVTRCPVHEVVLAPGADTQADVDCDSGLR